MDGKICAMVRQTWYETAKKNLDQADRLRFYECVFEYEFNDIEPNETAPLAVRLLFDMVRDALDQDKNKARTRAEIARQNGALGGRPKSNETQQESEKPNRFSKNQSGFNGLPQHNTTIQNTTKNNISLSTNEDTHTFFDCCLLFFEKGVKDPLEEVNLFWNFYAAKGWKTGENDIVDRYALAKAWRPKDCSAALMKQRQDYALLLRMLGTDNLQYITDFRALHVDKSAGTVDICVANADTARLIDSAQKVLAEWIPKRATGENYTLTYSIPQE